MGPREVALLTACILALSVFTSCSPYFFTGGNFATIARNSVELMVIGLGMTLVLAIGGIDISLGAAMGVSAFFVGRSIEMGFSPILIVMVGPLAGSVMGGVSAFTIIAGRIPPIIATLGLFGIYRALIFFLLGGRWLSGLEDVLGTVVKTSIFGVPLLSLQILALFLAGYVILRRTPLGVAILAIGGNEHSAHLAGIRIVRTKVFVYVTGGFLAGIAATYYVAQYRNVEMTVGGTVALDAIVAAVLGGATVLGGRVSLLGTALGVILVRMLQNGLLLIGVPSLWQQTIIGGLLISVLVIDAVTPQLKGRKPKAWQEA